MCSLFGSCLALILDDFPKLSILMMGHEDFVLSELLSFCRQPLCWSLLIGTGTH